MIVAFIDELRQERIAVELTCALLGEQGLRGHREDYRAGGSRTGRLRPES
jgi:hypothetical protein